VSLVARENLLIRKNEWLPGTGPSPSKPNPAAFHSNGPSNEGFKFVPSHHKRGKSGKKKNHYHSNNSSNFNTAVAVKRKSKGRKRSAF
jgi:hypothetical protein